MKAEYDFSQGKRRALLPSKGKTRITIYIDDAILDEFRARADEAGTGYQTMMNEALKSYLAGGADRPITEELPAARLTARPTGKHAKSARSR
jgi:BrnA antitoxin of type II toxin-antitoxin system